MEPVKQPATEKQPVAGNPAVIAMRVARIEFIRLTSSEFRCAEDNELNGEVVPVNITGPVASRLEDNLLSVRLNLVLRLAKKTDALPTSDTMHDVATLRGSFEVGYRLDGGSELESRDIEAFAHINGMFNVVPYWREFVVSMLSRAGLPHYEVPPFNPAKMAREHAKAAGSGVVAPKA